MATPQSTEPNRRSAAGFGLGRERFALLFAVMLVAAAGNTAMQSLLPAIGRALGIADLWVAVGVQPVGGHLGGDGASLGAARRPSRAPGADAARPLRLHRLDADLRRRARGRAGRAGSAPTAVFVDLHPRPRRSTARWGSASPPAVQAYVAARTEGEQRTGALAAIASSFGLGTIIGPAIAPLFIFPPLGLSGPLIVFAGIGAVVLAADRAAAARRHAQATRRAGRIVDYPSIGGDGGGDRAETRRRRRRKLRWRDPRVLRLAPDRHRRRPRPGGPARRDRLPGHRPARPAARPGAAMDRDRADRRRGRVACSRNGG